MPSEHRLTPDQIAAYLEQCPGEVCDLVLAMREVVLKAAPGVTEAIKFHSLCYYMADSPYGAIGGNVCTIDGRSGVVGWASFRGATLPDPKGFLQGDGRPSRTIDIRSVRQARSRAIAN
ncbi:MAG: DUF1801 domain-containing protein [Planctomycetes bacterium]|nr:DUF1801 domain-containing protein [Planctomycetota bacterium]